MCRVERGIYVAVLSVLGPPNLGYPDRRWIWSSWWNGSSFSNVRCKVKTYKSRSFELDRTHCPRSDVVFWLVTVVIIGLVPCSAELLGTIDSRIVGSLFYRLVHPFSSLRRSKSVEDRLFLLYCIFFCFFNHPLTSFSKGQSSADVSKHSWSPTSYDLRAIYLWKCCKWVWLGVASACKDVQACFAPCGSEVIILFRDLHCENIREYTWVLSTDKCDHEARPANALLLTGAGLVSGRGASWFGVCRWPQDTHCYRAWGLNSWRWILMFHATCRLAIYQYCFRFNVFQWLTVNRAFEESIEADESDDPLQLWLR